MQKKSMDKIIDIHSHTLWGIDDGSSDFNETMRMCFDAEDNGTSVLFVTPHLMYWEQAEDLFDIRNEKVAMLQDELLENDSDLIIKSGFEILCDDDIFSVKHFLPYTLNGSRYILIEFDFFKTTERDVASWCDYLKSFGLIPIIAHPERYGFVQDDITALNRFSDKGVLFQINVGSPAGDFGDEELQISTQMINCGFADFIGSDAHSNVGRNTEIGVLFEDYPYSCDMDLVELAACENPKFILKDGIYVPKRKKYLAKS
jgi:protein-tyrosine phosphatase